jgi:hypothetical protein
MADPPDTIALLAALVHAHDQPTGDGRREPILFVQLLGGPVLQHPGLTRETLPPYDEAALNELRAQGLISWTGSGGSYQITPTPAGRNTVAALERIRNEEPVADLAPPLAAVAVQAGAANALAWPAVRPVLQSLSDYWASGGYSSHGIQLAALRSACPDERIGLLAATIRALVEGGYLESVGGLEFLDMPAEAKLTDRARAVLDGWPGAEPADLVENLLAVLAERAQAEPDPSQKRRLQVVLDTLKELGVSVTSELLAKVITGGR